MSRLGIVALLTLLSVVVTVLLPVLDLRRQGSLERWFDVNLEAGLPAWYSTILLFLAAQTLWRLSEQGSRGDRSRWRRHERVLAGVFVLLSIDEMTQIHEEVNGLLRSLQDTSPLLAYPWVVVGLPAAALVGLVMLSWLRALPTRTRRRLVVSGAVFVGGAVGMEVVSAVAGTVYGRDGVAYVAAYTVEETLEMVGVVIFLWALDDLLRDRRAGEARLAGGGAPGMLSGR